MRQTRATGRSDVHEVFEHPVLPRARRQRGPDQPPAADRAEIRSGYRPAARLDARARAHRCRFLLRHLRLCHCLYRRGFAPSALRAVPGDTHLPGLLVLYFDSAGGLPDSARRGEHVLCASAVDPEILSALAPGCRSSACSRLDADPRDVLLSGIRRAAGPARADPARAARLGACDRRSVRPRLSRQPRARHRIQSTDLSVHRRCAGRPCDPRRIRPLRVRQPSHRRGACPRRPDRGSVIRPVPERPA